MSPYSITREDAALDLAALRGTIAACQRADLTTPSVLRELADSIEEQVQPTITEPTEWGSVVKATCELGPRGGLFWVKAGRFWISDATGPTGDGMSTLWQHLRVIEVLRVGVGEPEQDSYSPAAYKHKTTCEWPECPGGEDCEGLSLLRETTMTLTEPEQVEATSAPGGEDAIEALVQDTANALRETYGHPFDGWRRELRDFASAVLEVGGQQPGVPVTDAMVETAARRLRPIAFDETHPSHFGLGDSRSAARHDARVALDAALLPKGPTS